MDSKYELRKIGIKSCTYQYFVDIIKIKDADFDNILIDEKSYENVLVYNILCKTLIGANNCVLVFIKCMDSLELMIELDVQYYFTSKNTRFLAG